MLAAADDAESMQAMLDRWPQERGAEGPPRPEWLRMAAVAAWSRASRSPRWAASLDAALAASASRGDLAGVGEMIARLAAEATPPSPLAQAWQEAWAARDRAVRVGGVEDWLEAADRLLRVANMLAARGEPGRPGAARFERLAVECLLEAGSPAEAIAVLDRSGDESPESAWLRLVALDRLRGIGTPEARSSATAEWNEAGRRFLEMHPDHPRASLVAVRLGGERMDLPSLEAFATTRDPQLAREARVAIAERLAIAAKEDRLELARTLRRLGPTMLERDRALAKDPAARREAMGLLEASLVVEDPDPARAAALIDLLDPEAAAVAGAAISARDRDAWLLHRADLAWIEGDAAAAQNYRDLAMNAARNRGDSAWAGAAARRWLARIAATWSPESADAASSEASGAPRATCSNSPMHPIRSCRPRRSRRCGRRKRDGESQATSDMPDRGATPRRERWRWRPPSPRRPRSQRRRSRLATRTPRSRPPARRCLDRRVATRGGGGRSGCRSRRSRSSILRRLARCSSSGRCSIRSGARVRTAGRSSNSIGDFRRLRLERGRHERWRPANRAPDDRRTASLRRFLGVAPGAEPRVVLAIEAGEITVGRVETAAQRRWRQIAEHPASGEPDAHFAKQAVLAAAESLLGRPPGGAIEAATPQTRLDRAIVDVLRASRGLNHEASLRLAGLARRTGLSPAAMLARVRRIVDRRDAVGMPRRFDRIPQRRRLAARGSEASELSRLLAEVETVVDADRVDGERSAPLRAQSSSGSCSR